MFKVERKASYIILLISGLIQKAIKGDFAEDEKLKVSLSLFPSFGWLHAPIRQQWCLKTN
jgi:hypothetical protein